MGARKWGCGGDGMSQSQHIGQVKVLLSQTYLHQHGKKEIRLNYCMNLADVCGVLTRRDIVRQNLISPTQ